MNDHSESIESTILALSKKLLNSIDENDYQTYSSLCAPNLTAYEPETKGVLVEGLEFHKFFFENKLGLGLEAGVGVGAENKKK